MAAIMRAESSFVRRVRDWIVYTDDGNGGGGGRIAVIYHSPLGLPAGNVTVTGGAGVYGNGQDGTVYLHQQ